MDYFHLWVLFTSDFQICTATESTKEIVRMLHCSNKRYSPCCPDKDVPLFLNSGTVVGDHINIVKTNFLSKFLLLASFFRITSLQVIKEKLFLMTASLCFHFLCIHAI